MKYFKLTILPTLLALFFSACGGGGDASFENATTTVSLDGLTCVTGTPSATDIDGYETLYSGDVLVKLTDDTVISIYHDVDGLKKVCLVSGSAYIARN